MRLLLIVNATASSVTARARVVIHKALSADHEVSVAETSRRGHATRLAQGAATQGVDVVVALGGDGTLNEAANGLAGTQTALAVLPGGSTNVFARTLGLPNDPIEATGVLLDALERGAWRAVSVGSINGRLFLFHAGVGLDAAVVRRVEQRGSLKRYAGQALFVWAALGTWLLPAQRPRPWFSVSACSEGSAATAVGRGELAIVLKTDPYTFLGNRPLTLAPGTGIDTGLTLLSLPSLAVPTVTPLVLRALRGRSGLEGRPGVRIVREVHHAVLEGPEPLPYQADGDFLGEARRLEIRLRAGALRLLAPPGPCPAAAQRAPAATGTSPGETTP